MNAENIVIFFIVAFSFGLILIMKRESIPDRLRRPLAIMAVIMVAFAFVLVLLSFFKSL